MAMVVQHNLTAMNASRMLGVTTGQQAKQSEKLASGYRINRAADDAAGLSISEKMRKQIRGLSQASTNAQDGVSAVQTAEGALTEVHSMLQRMNELAVQSANGTNSETDRQAIQDEITELKTEIDRVAETTKFNETYLLKGDKAATKEYSFAYNSAAGTALEFADGVAATDFGTVKDATPAGVEVASGVSFTVSYNADNDTVESTSDVTFTYNKDAGSWQTSGADVDLADYGITLSSAATDADNGKTITFKATVAESYQAFGDEEEMKEALDAGKEIYMGSLNAQPIDGAYTYEKEGDVFYDADGNKIAENGLSNYIDVDVDGNMSLKEGVKIYSDATAETELTSVAGLVTATQDITGKLNLKLHVGADATTNNQITLDINAMDTKALGINELKVDGKDDTNALAAIDTIKQAIQKVSTQRSTLGAVQNRLEHTIANLDNVVENTTSAESRIRDTDMAEAMVEYSKNNILAQAGQSMLAQANQSTQGVLSLLQ